MFEGADVYKIKYLIVKPGKRLSLKKYYHRSEHWIVVSGTRTVIVDNEVKTVRSNESTYIKIKKVHCLVNEGKIDAIFKEARVG